MRNQLKKLVSIFLLFAVLFSSGGELILRQVLVFQTDRYFNRLTSHGLYNLGDVTEIKIPANLPGIADQTNFEKTFGEVRFADAAYNYVGIRVTQTAIYLRCVPNYETTRLCGQNIIHAEGIKELPIQKKEHVPHGKSSAVACFRFQFYSFEFTIPVKNILSQRSDQSGRQSDRDIEIPQPPPKITA